MDDMQRAKGEALAFFLLKEIGRHHQDIQRAWDDIKILHEKGIHIPQQSEIDVDTWIEP